MGALVIKNVFGIEGLALETEGLDPAALGERLGDGRVDPVTLSLECPAADLAVLDQVVTLKAGAGVSLTVAVCPPTADRPAWKDPFLAAPLPEPPAGTRWVEFTADGRFDASANANYAPAAALRLSATASRLGELHYRHLLQVATSDSRATALTAVTQGARLPGRSLDGGLAPGQCFELRGLLRLGLDARASRGGSWLAQATATLFDGFSQRVTCAVEATVEAALGLALFDEVSLAVGTACQVNPEWVRIRAARTHEDRLTLGAIVALTVTHGAGSVLATILDHLFSLAPLARTIETLAEIAQKLADGEWKDLLGRLSDDAARLFLAAADDRGWVDWDDARITGFTASVDRVVEAFAGLDGRVASWWESLLGRVDLGSDSPARTALAALADLDPDDPNLASHALDAAIEPGGGALRTTLELLTGESLEDLLTMVGPSATAKVADAVRIARQGRSFLVDTPDALAGAIDDFARQVGIAGVADWLAANATSPDALKAAATRAVRGVVSRLLDTAWEEIASPGDVALVRAWAGRVADALRCADDWHAGVKRDLEKLDGTFGASLAVELSRVTRESALIDLEVDPDAKDIMRPMSVAIAAGDVAAILRVADAAVDRATRPDGAHESAPVLVRECLLTSSRLRTSTLSSLLTLFGADIHGAHQRRRATEAEVRVKQSPKGTLSRRGSYVASFSQEDRPSRETFTSTVAVRASATAQDGAVWRPYAAIVEPELRLTVRYEDDKLAPAEAAAIDRLLDRLGFAGPQAAAGAVEAGCRDARFALQVGMDGTAVRALLDTRNRASWGRDVLAAAHAWLGDELLTQAESVCEKHTRCGDVMAALLRDPTVGAAMCSGSLELLEVLGRPFRLRLKNWETGTSQTVLVRPVRSGSGAKTLVPAFEALRNLADCRGRGWSAMRVARGSWGLAQHSMAPEALAGFGTELARALDVCSPSGSTYPNPMFDFWLALARVWRAAPAALATARGYATLRTRTNDIWSEPASWSLTAGVRAAVFPDRQPATRRRAGSPPG
jgi:hypothetical protein